MKKVQVSPLQEILDVHVTRVQDYLEEALQMILKNYLGSTSGVIYGLEPTYNSGLFLNISSGAIITDGIFGEIDAPTGIFLEPTASSGIFRTDLIVASYQEVLDTFSSGYVLLDVATRVEQIISLPNRRFGTILIEQLKGTTYANRPSDKVPICEVVVTNNTITSLTDYRIFSSIGRFNELGFNGLFYGSLY